MLKNFKLFIALTLSACLFSGCSSLMWWDKVPPKLIVNIKTDENINPNIDNEATPVSIEIVQLESDDVFVKTPFIEMYNNAHASLKNTFVSSKIVRSINPSSELKIDVLLNARTNFIGAIVGFSQYDNYNGKIVIPIKNKGKDKELQLFINGLKVELKEKD